MIAIPTAVQLFCWIATLWTGRIDLRPPLLFVLGFFFVLVIVESISAIAAHEHRQASLTTNMSEAFDTMALCILHDVQLVIEKIVMFKRHSTLFMYN